ncbi:hypothetical protein Cob_v010848 [Colletotrichum orbiculare MAFF 240422]|uniref:C2H2-type domain-containing protein n=1 Tax=Colletotrichum orbiculare (strain 104-T / ATCC 96160 / CBS 514.97 / LARS 414 / MAFF 240422) TaxID=1213857 RepID=A0A484FFD8_COLOR|nr:hypothetical protein Cob_v010848 [Colletotrichum orbiculare MAFF 240422]
MALPRHPSVYDRLDDHDFDGDPARPMPAPALCATSVVNVGDENHTLDDSTPVLPGSYVRDRPQEHHLDQALLSFPHQPILLSAMTSPFGGCPSRVKHNAMSSYLGNVFHFSGRPSKARIVFAHVDTLAVSDTSRPRPTPRQRSTLEIDDDVNHSRRLAKDLRTFLAQIQPSPFVNHYAQLIAEYTTLYDHQEHFYQQYSTSETELTEMSVGTITNGSGSESPTTNYPETTPLLSTMAVTTSDWAPAAQSGCAAPDDFMENHVLYQHGASPLSELCEVPDEMVDWSMLMNQDMLATGDFDFSFAETDFNYLQPTPSPEDIFNDPVVQFDIEQSLQMFITLNEPLPDLSASDYLSGTDHLSGSSYFGSANTSPYEPSLDFFPDTVGTFSSGSASPPFGVPTTSPSISDADHPFRCKTDNCAKSFRKESQWKQHQRVHRKALVCKICRAENSTEHKFAQVRDLERHMQARHRDVAEKTNVSDDHNVDLRVICPMAYPKRTTD